MDTIFDLFHLIGLVVITIMVAVTSFYIICGVIAGKCPRTSIGKIDMWFSIILFYPCALYVVYLTWENFL